MQELQKNIAAVLEALKFSPENHPLKRHAAQLLIQAGRHEEGIRLLEEILEKESEPDTVHLLAQAWYDQGQFRKAEACLQRTGEPTPQMRMLAAKIALALEDAQEAADRYQEALEEDPSLEDPEFQEELQQQGAKVKARLKVLEFRKNALDEDVERPTLTFQDVGGLEKLKENIRMNIIYPFQNPDLFRSYGKKTGGGILLYGPPGCGKTFIARATAGECNAHFISLDIHRILDMYIGQSEKNLHELFETARRHAPTIIFIDELDAIGGARQQGQSAHSRALTNQLLNELDGIHSDNRDILVLGATNTPWFVDSALRRPGRFDRVLFVAPPDLEARVEILHIHLKEKPVEEIDYVKVAKKTDRFSGADLRAVVDTAADMAIREAMKTGQKRPITTSMLVQAVKEVKPSTLEWMSTAKNYATYSNQAGTYDEILEYLNK
ncbi:AAA family ATPase [Kroppenstedtia eburnea]|uniref:AAA family ATPase n=1 Tax=Kroppenstedtia eburnea TaxID=714067 RepID=UPI00058E4DE0